MHAGTVRAEPDLLNWAGLSGGGMPRAVILVLSIQNIENEENGHRKIVWNASLTCYDRRVLRCLTGCSCRSACPPTRPRPARSTP